MRRHEHGLQVFHPAIDRRHRYAIPAPTCVPVPIEGGLRMPVTVEDVDKLRSLVRYLKSAESKMSERDRLRESNDALERAVVMLERGQKDTIKDFMLSAVLTAYKEDRPGHWVLHDPSLMTWALNQIKALPTGTH